VCVNGGMSCWRFETAAVVCVLIVGVLGGCTSGSTSRPETGTKEASAIGHWRLMDIARRGNSAMTIPRQDRTAWLEFTNDNVLASDGVNGFQAEYQISDSTLVISQVTATLVGVSPTAPPIIKEIVGGIGSMLDASSGSEPARSSVAITGVNLTVTTTTYSLHFIHDGPVRPADTASAATTTSRSN
jgi:hypothetical protein